MPLAAVPEEVENSMVLASMEEAKQLVDKAYKERRERWECQALASPGQTCSTPFGDGAHSKGSVERMETLRGTLDLSMCP